MDSTTNDIREEIDKIISEIAFLIERKRKLRLKLRLAQHEERATQLIVQEEKRIVKEREDLRKKLLQ